MFIASTSLPTRRDLLVFANANTLRISGKNLLVALVSLLLTLAAHEIKAADSPGTSESSSAGVAESITMGVRETTVQGQVFRIINGRNCTARINPDGSVKLIYPESQPSFNGKNNTKAWVMNSYMVPLKASELSALSTTGLKLPEGNHTFYIYYIDPKKATTPEQLRANWWEIVMNPDTYRNFSAPAEYVLLEIKDVVAKDSPEIKAPSDIRATTWYPQYQETTNDLSLPPDKKFGITKRVSGIPATRLVEQGQYLQAVYGDVNNNLIPYNRTWVDPPRLP